VRTDNTWCQQNVGGQATAPRLTIAATANQDPTMAYTTLASRGRPSSKTGAQSQQPERRQAFRRLVK
jgi:hypothetical protein